LSTRSHSAIGWSFGKPISSDNVRGHIVDDARFTALARTDNNSCHPLFAGKQTLAGEAFLSAVPIADTSIEKRRIVLEGDIPSAINPPPGCPFQARCRWKRRVPGNPCETILPPMTTFWRGHLIRRHLARAILDEMEPVITQVGQKRSMER
jgi:oligopeptide/dipeptide ABC transporter ATP-binding protein